MNSVLQDAQEKGLCQRHPAACASRKVMIRRHPRSRTILSGAADVCRARGLTGRLLRLAPMPGEHPCNLQFCAAGRDPVHRGERYGSPRVHALLRTQGRGASRGRIERLMRRHGSRAIAPPRRVRTIDSRHNLPIAPNLIACDFTAAAPNRAWLADITYIPAAEGWLYLAAVVDLFSRKIIG